jgi:hypothetical protein
MLPGFTGSIATAIPLQVAPQVQTHIAQANQAIPQSQGVALAGIAQPGCHLETSCYGILQFCHTVCDGRVAQSWQCGWCIGVWGW